MNGMLVAVTSVTEQRVWKKDWRLDRLISFFRFNKQALI